MREVAAANMYVSMSFEKSKLFVLNGSSGLALDINLFASVNYSGFVSLFVAHIFSG